MPFGIRVNFHLVVEARLRLSATEYDTCLFVGWQSQPAASGGFAVL